MNLPATIEAGQLPCFAFVVTAAHVVAATVAASTSYRLLVQEADGVQRARAEPRNVL